MRVYHFAIIFSLICRSVMAGEPPETGISTAISTNIGPFSIGRPHTCASYYPAAALKARVQGTTLMEFIVTDSGGVKDIGQLDLRFVGGGLSVEHKITSLL